MKIEKIYITELVLVKSYNKGPVFFVAKTLKCITYH